MTTTLQDLKPSQIKPNKANPRTDVGNVDELAASIREAGILEPLIVAPNGTGTTFVLIAGHRRLAAAKDAKCKTVPCIVREDLDDPAVQLEHMLIENLHRADLTPVEEAQAYQQLLEFPGYTMKRITQATGRSAATVRNRIGLAKLPDAVRSKLQSGQVSLVDAQAMVEFASDVDTAARLERALGTDNFPFEVERARRDRKEAKDWAAAEAKLRKAGVRVVTEDELEQLLEDKPPEMSSEDVWVYVDPDGDLDDLRMTPEFHASCPGHAAVLEHAWRTNNSTSVRSVIPRYICTQPAEHPELAAQRDGGPVDDQDEDDEERAARIAREEAIAERARIREELEIAAKVRRAHLIAFAKDTIKAEHESRTLLRQVIVSNCERDDQARAVLGGMLVPDQEDRATAKRIGEELPGLTLPALAVLIDVMDNASADSALDRAECWGPTKDTNSYYHPHTTTEAWRRKLVDVYGYQFSDIEAKLNAPPAIVDVDLPADDADA